MAVRDRDGHAGRHHRPLPRLDRDALGRAQVESRVARMLRLRQLPLGPGAREGKVHVSHSGSISSRRFPNGSRTCTRRNPENWSDSITL